MRIYERLSNWIGSIATNTYQYLSAKLTDLAKRISHLADVVFKRAPSTTFEREINAKVVQAPLTLEELIRELDAWVNANPAEAEDRNIAKNLIIECFKNKTTELTLKEDMELESKRTIITELPAVICRLEHLERLDISGIDLNSLPEEIGSLTNLQVLYAEYNKLTKLPAGINNLKELRTLNISLNQFTEFPDLSSCKYLKRITAGQNKITSLPNSIGELIFLELLNLDSNALSTLPAKIGGLSSLQELRLANNQIKTLPSKIGRLSCLAKLYIADNQLTSLPVEIGNLGRLYMLDIQNNTELAELPLTLAGCAKLQILGHGSGVDVDRKPKQISDGRFISDGTVRYFQLRCDALGNTNYTKWDQFNSLLNVWAVVTNRDANFEHLLFYQPEEREAIEEWLEFEAFDIIPGQQKESAAKVCEMLEKLKDNEAWKKVFFEGIDEEMTLDELYSLSQK